MNRIADHRGKFRFEGAIGQAAMDEAILDVLASRLPHCEERELSLTIELDDYEIAISSAQDDIPLGVEEAVRAIVEIASPHQRTREADMAYQVDTSAPSATLRALAEQELAAEAEAARARTCKLLASHGKRKELQVFLRGIRKAQSPNPGDDE